MTALKEEIMRIAGVRFPRPCTESTCVKRWLSEKEYGAAAIMLVMETVL